MKNVEHCWIYSTCNARYNYCNKMLWYCLSFGIDLQHQMYEHSISYIVHLVLVHSMHSVDFLGARSGLALEWGLSPKRHQLWTVISEVPILIEAYRYLLCWSQRFPLRYWGRQPPQMLRKGQMPSVPSCRSATVLDQSAGNDAVNLDLWIGFWVRIQTA